MEGVQGQQAFVSRDLYGAGFCVCALRGFQGSGVARCITLACSGRGRVGIFPLDNHPRSTDHEAATRAAPLMQKPLASCV